MGFAIKQWAAWAPGLTTQDAWREWLRNPHTLPVEGKPELLELPAMQRRRINRLGRMALQVAYWCCAHESQPLNCPVIFASRHGDVMRSETLLRSLASDEPLSPTDFSMSVHNAIGALFSIARNDTNNYLAIAAGTITVETAFVEAIALLATEAEQVLMVVYDEPLPSSYSEFADELAYPFAWACVLTSGSIDLAWQAPSASTQNEKSALPHSLEVLSLLIGEKTSITHHTAESSWFWQNNSYV